MSRRRTGRLFAHYDPLAMPDPASASTPRPSSVWASADLSGNPHHDSEKHEKVRRMFAAIARRYDLNNRLHSFGRDQAWRRFAVRAARVGPGDAVLDVACGTGDLTQAFAATEAARVVGLDFTREMLELARAKRAALDPSVAAKVEYVEGDAQRLPFEPACFHVVSIAFGIRNVADPSLAMREFARVLRPGGRLVILEFGRPSWAPLRLINDFYCGWIMPRTATWISGDRSGAYKYLPRSVGTFMTPDELAARAASAGLVEHSRRSLTFGVCACYVFLKSESAP